MARLRFSRLRLSARSLLGLLSALSLLVPLAACGGGSGSPTDPAPPALGGTASIEGQVSVTGQTGGALSAPAGPAGSGGVPTVGRGGARSAPAGGGPTALTAADSSGAGVVIRIAGTPLATTAAADGSFRLDGAPSGDIRLEFEAGGQTAALGIDQVQPNERIRIDVEITGSQARVHSMERSGGDPEEPEEEPETVELSLDIEPDDWNTNYDRSAGTVTAFVRGQGFELVLLDTLELTGTDPGAEPLAPVDVSRQGDHVRARFAKSDLLDLLEDPQPGSVHPVTLAFFVDGSDDLFELTEDVTVVGPGEDEEEEGDEEQDEEEDEEEELDDLSLQLSPSTWNTNFSRSSGHVTAFIRGTGLGAIDLDSIELVGDDPEADPLPASFARLEGNHVRAQFPKSEVLDLLDEPARDSRHTVLVTFTANGGLDSFELEAEVRVTGPAS